MADVVIVSSCYGDFDPFHPQAEQDVDVDWVYVTDAEKASPPWRVEVRPTDLHPRMAAKLPKFFPPDGYRYAIWINASYEITSPTFVREALTFLNDGIALYQHPYRDCIYEELVASRLPKYDGEPMAEQVERYREDGHPESYGLWECGLVVWDRENPKVKEFSQAWLEEVERWSVQDQLSFAYLCRRLNVKPGIFDHDLLQSRWVTFPHAHLR